MVELWHQVSSPAPGEEAFAYPMVHFFLWLVFQGTNQMYVLRPQLLIPRSFFLSLADAPLRHTWFIARGRIVWDLDRPLVHGVWARLGVRANDVERLAAVVGQRELAHSSAVARLLNIFIGQLAVVTLVGHG